MKAMLILVLSLTGRPIATEAAPYQPVSVELERLSREIASIQASAEGLAAISCAQGEYRGFLGSYPGSAGEALKNTRAAVQGYLREVARGFDGSGKCDGSFAKVSREALRRMELASETLNLVYRSGALLEDRFIAGYGKRIDFESAGDECPRQFNQALDGFNSGNLAALDLFQSAVESLADDAERFLRYAERNRALALRCGAGDEELSRMIRQAGAKYGVDLAAVPAGRGERPESTITGNSKPDALASSKPESKPKLSPEAEPARMPEGPGAAFPPEEPAARAARGNDGGLRLGRVNGIVGALGGRGELAPSGEMLGSGREWGEDRKRRALAEFFPREKRNELQAGAAAPTGSPEPALQPEEEAGGIRFAALRQDAAGHAGLSLFARVRAKHRSCGLFR